MSYSEVVETKGQYRAVIIADEDAAIPDWDGMYPTLQIDNYSVGPLLGEGAADFAVILSTFISAVPEPLETFERYLRIFHGTTQFATYNLGKSREYGYVAFDTAKWRESQGIDHPEHIKEEDMLSDVRSWAEGDVWGVRIEKLVTWSTEDEEVEDQDLSDWEELESVWGHYGREYAEQSAREALSLYAGR